LLGWSFGGVVAHQVAVELERRGGVVARLVLLDAEPHLNGHANQAVDKDQLHRLVRDHVDWEADGELATHEPLLDRMVENFDANVALYREHEAGVFRGDLVVFSAERDEPDRQAFLQRTWEPHVAGDVVVHPTDSTHQEMLTTEALSSYGEHLARVLGHETART
jgi:thioesterase domain-containing protein